MSDTTAEPLDAADGWPDARPPHLPDRLTAVPWMAWPYVAVAVVLLWLAWPDLRVAFSPGEFSLLLLIFALEPPAVALLGAALFWRHPDALPTLPRVVMGVTLLAAREVLRALAPALTSVFATITPAPEAFPVFVPLSTAYFAFATAVGIFGLVYLARGLADARRLDDSGSRRSITIAVAALALLLGAAQWSLVRDLPADDSMTIGTMLVVSLGLTTLNLLAWGYLTLTVGRGWLAGEAPTRAWLVATLAGVCVFISTLLRAIIDWVVLSPSDPAFLIAQAASLIGIAAYFLLLVAVAFGLPSTAQVAWVDAEKPGVGEDESMLDRLAGPLPGSARS